MRRRLGVLAIGIALLGATAALHAQEPSAGDKPVLVQVDGLAPMLLYGDSPGEAARAYVAHTRSEHLFPKGQEALETWAKSRSSSAPATELATLRRGDRPIIGVQLNSAGSVLGGDHITPRMEAVVRNIRESGGEPLLLPPGYQAEKIDALLGAVDHLVLVGGDDVHPSLYGEKVTYAHRHELNLKRDLYEREVIRRARETGVPLIGICRGCQILNVASGGSLHQDINKEGVTSELHTGKDYARQSHDVVIEPQSRMAETFGATRIKDVASLHHGAVKTPGTDIEVVGRSPDGVVEGIESKDGKARGYQFHPEMDPAYSRAVFSDVIKEAKQSRSYRRRRGQPGRRSGGSSLLRTRERRRQRVRRQVHRTRRPAARRPRGRRARRVRRIGRR